MTAAEIQELCELGQTKLIATDYLGAIDALREAERGATELSDFDTLSRLYMPLQEARRQRRQRCGEGIVCLDLIATGPDDHIDARHVVENFSHGQLLVAGWGTVQPAVQVRALAEEHELFLETYLAAVYPVGDSLAVVIAPLAEVSLPPVQKRQTIDQLLPTLPPHCVVMHESKLPSGSVKGSPQTFAQTMALWEQLHAPFLALADATTDLSAKLDGYRKTIRVDEACELAHQNFSAAARETARTKRR